MTKGQRLNKKQKRMQQAIRLLTEYMATYENQAECLNYSDATLIDDVLYALGVAIDTKNHRFAGGYDVWKLKLQKHLEGAPGEIRL